MKKYSVVYAEDSTLNSKSIIVQAKTKADAYVTAMEILGWNTYASYVEGYITKTGKFHYFYDTCFGNAY